jgi:hypothetical protein
MAMQDRGGLRSAYWQFTISFFLDSNHSKKPLGRHEGADNCEPR